MAITATRTSSASTRVSSRSPTRPLRLRRLHPLPPRRPARRAVGVPARHHARGHRRRARRERRGARKEAGRREPDSHSSRAEPTTPDRTMSIQPKPLPFAPAVGDSVLLTADNTRVAALGAICMRCKKTTYAMIDGEETPNNPGLQFVVSERGARKCGGKTRRANGRAWPQKRN